MQERIEINPGEWFLVAEPTLLVHEWETVLGDAVKIGAQESRPIYLFTFQGKINNKDETGVFTIAMPLMSAWDLVGQILDGLELYQKAAKEAITDDT